MKTETEYRTMPNWFGISVVLALSLALIGREKVTNYGHWAVLFPLLYIVGSLSSSSLLENARKREFGVFFLSIIQALLGLLMVKISGGIFSPLWPVFIFPILNSVFYLEKREKYFIVFLTEAFLFLSTLPHSTTSLRHFIIFISEFFIILIFFFFLEHLKMREIEKIKVLTDKTAKDFLTGLYSRGFLVELIKNMLEKSKKTKKPFALIMIDLDNFKKLNDTKGHQMGDAVLREFGRFLRKNIRASDIPVRYGGDEFLILLPATDEESARIVLDKLRERMEKFAFLKKNGLGMSAGISVYPVDGEDIDTLLKKADTRLYKNKEERKKEGIIYSLKDR